MSQILNKRNIIGELTDNQIYIGRPSKWRNPFIIGRDGNREQVIELYRNYITTNKELLASLHELHGKDLVCWCAPEACHGQILLELANWSPA